MAVGLDLLPRLLDPLPGGKGLVNAVDLVVNWARANSLWPLVYGTSCCAIEMMATGAARHDIARFGAEVFRASPRQADLIIIAGTLTEKMSGHLQTLYEQMPEPKYVMAMGACTISGGPFYYDNYSVVKGADRIVPVDVFIPGCPPRPEALLHGLLQLQASIRSESIRRPRRAPPLETTPIHDRHSAEAAHWAGLEAARQAELEPERAAWIAAHPDHQPYRHVKLDKPKSDPVPYQPRVAPGLAAARIWELVSARFPGVALHGLKDPSTAGLAAAPSDHQLDLVVEEGDYLALVDFLRSHEELVADFLLQITAVDFQDRIDVLVHLLSTPRKHRIFVRCAVKRDGGSLPTLSGLYPAAEWHEREVMEMFGVTFVGHPDPRRLFLPVGLSGYPLRKDFSDPGRVVPRPY